MKQLEVQIMGQSYLLACPENGDAQMLDAVNRVDLAMCKIRDAGKIRARDRIAVLAALNLAFELPGRGLTAEAPPALQPWAASGNASANDRSDLRVAALLAQLDAALGVDGQLL